ncbi:26820_t:CDS:2, partial [Gigaspora margarita]
MGKRQNSKTVELINQISQTSDNIPPSPTPQLCQHTCPKCSKSITCRIYNNKHYPNESYILVDKKVYHTNSKSTSTLLTQPTILLTQSLANSLSNINTNKTFQTSQTQSSVKYTYSSKLKSQTNPLSSTLGPLTSTETLQTSSMDIDNTSNKHACEILKTGTSNSESANQHTYQNIYQYYYKESLNLYPASTPLSSSPKQSIIHPTLDYSIFEKNRT